SQRQTRVRNKNACNTYENTIITLLRTAKRHATSFAPLKLSKHLKKQLPTWMHLGASPRTYHETRDACLKTLHKTKRIKNLAKLTRRLIDVHLRHLPDPACVCIPCMRDRQRGCKNPHKCAATAREILARLTPKFDPSTRSPNDNLTLTHHRREKNSRASVKSGDELIFDPTVTARSSPPEYFRIF
ncbi:hypothetical protein J3R83DRAFT_7701, partial [Lanmaoa asiatica]